MSPPPTAVLTTPLPAEDEEVAALRRTLVAKLAYSVGKDPTVASEHDWFVATALTVRDRIIDVWLPSTRTIYRDHRKRVYSLSLDFLIGRLLKASLHALGLPEPMRRAL